MKKLLVLWFMLLLILPNGAKHSEIISQPQFMLERPSLSLVTSATQAWPLREVLQLTDPKAQVEIIPTQAGCIYLINRTDMPSLILEYGAEGWQVTIEHTHYPLTSDEVSLDNDQLQVSLRFMNRFFPERFCYDANKLALVVDRSFPNHLLFVEQTSEPIFTAQESLSLSKGYQALAYRPNQNSKLDPTLVKLAFKSLPISLDFLHQHQVNLYPYLVSTASGNGINAVTFPTNKTYLFTQSLLYESCYHETVTHELGHQVLFHLKDQTLLRKYLKVRGLKDASTYNNSVTTAYQNRIHEIFAEDFRILIGNDYATSLPHHNTQLPPPEQVKELREVMEEIIDSIQNQR